LPIEGSEADSLQAGYPCPITLKALIIIITIKIITLLMFCLRNTTAATTTTTTTTIFSRMTPD